MLDQSTRVAILRLHERGVGSRVDLNGGVTIRHAEDLAKNRSVVSIRLIISLKNENNRCSILFHLLVSGGKLRTVISSLQSCSLDTGYAALCG